MTETEKETQCKEKPSATVCLSTMLYQQLCEELDFRRIEVADLTTRYARLLEEKEKLLECIRDCEAAKGQPLKVTNLLTKAKK